MTKAFEGMLMSKAELRRIAGLSLRTAVQKSSPETVSFGHGIHSVPYAVGNVFRTKRIIPQFWNNVLRYRLGNRFRVNLDSSSDPDLRRQFPNRSIPWLQGTDGWSARYDRKTWPLCDRSRTGAPVQAVVVSRNPTEPARMNAMQATWNAPRRSPKTRNPIADAARIPIPAQIA